MLLFYIFQDSDKEVDSVTTMLFLKDEKKEYFHFSASINYIRAPKRLPRHTSLPLHNFYAKCKHRPRAPCNY